MNPVFPMFVGSGRSGTTLFRNVFDSHPDLAMTHEAHFVLPMTLERRRFETPNGIEVERFVAQLYANPNFVRQGLPEPTVRVALSAATPTSFADAVRTVFAAYAAQHGKRLYGDKTPGYVTNLRLLGEVFPEARFVHIIRDGRDVAMAYLDRSEWGPSTMADAALYWKSRVGRGRDAGRRLGSTRYREVRYEDMVDDPESVTRDLCTFLGLDFHPEMLEFHRRGEEFAAATPHPDAFRGLAQPITKGMRDWRTQMGPDDVALVEAIAGDLLSDLGYDVTGTASGGRIRTQALAAGAVWQVKRVTARLQPAVRRVRKRLRSG
jgi:hypothetical protein